ncbi:Hypothetical protein Cp1002B_0734 [Corynebacterium pseudotuberculosis]|nr:Hypothetical protein CpVD57_1945 [Corynebacterium pseudotuberculosis]AKJ56582.1 Hypothetical protein Cp12C_2011 [Corynebacterium pseudotuberculosis]ALM77314.1 Hypothetical protein Cp1002B_0734 [Corynebacterium pseudotuberculosis]ANH25519.1 Hypothetical protein CpMEX9_0718 [Corynebacterium pseudotuberculosis]ANQ78100.1 Hypothetical protein CpCP13_1950 [Corynebacterium pseudotuberculosis]
MLVTFLLVLCFICSCCALYGETLSAIVAGPQVDRLVLNFNTILSIGGGVGVSREVFIAVSAVGVNFLFTLILLAIGEND